MDHHVAEQSARAPHEFDRRRRGVVALYRQQLGAADPAGADFTFELREMRVETAVEADHQRDAAFAGHSNASLGAAAGESKRVLAKKSLAGARRPLDGVCLRTGRTRHPGSSERGDGKGLRLTADLGAIVGGEPFRGSPVWVDDNPYVRIGMGDDIAGVDRADAARAELAEIDHT